MRLNVSLIGAAILLTAGAASAQDVDCNNPKTQSDMTSCEAARHETADKALNVQYKKTRAALAAVDKDLDGDMKGAEQALVKAQRAWIDYRDAECDASASRPVAARWSRCWSPGASPISPTNAPKS